MTRTSSSKCPPALSVEEESKGRVARTINLETNRVPHHAGFACGVFDSASPTDRCSLIAAHHSRKSLPLNSFADPHLLTLSCQFLYKNRGEGCLQPSDSQVATFSPTLCLHKSLSCNAYASPRECCKQETYGTVKLFRCNAYKKHGGGGARFRGGGAVSPVFSGEPNANHAARLDYLLMSSLASSRLSKGCRNGFVASGAPLIACVISLAAVGKSPLFDEMRASARWLIQ